MSFKHLLISYLSNKIYLNADQYFLINMLVLFENAVTFAQTIRIHEIPYIFRKPYFHVSHYCVFSFNSHMISKPFLSRIPHLNAHHTYINRMSCITIDHFWEELNMERIFSWHLMSKVFISDFLKWIVYIVKRFIQ